MRLFWEELRKIVSRKLVWGGVLFLMILVTVWTIVAVSEEKTTIDGKTYRGREAVVKDKELAEEYKGVLTVEKVQDIYNRFGFYYYDTKTGEPVGNFCNYFITLNMTNFNQTGGEDLSQIEFYEGTEWENNAQPFVEGNTEFAYVRGWMLMQENAMTFCVYLQLILIIALCPLFSEEYSLRTADLLLTTEDGKKKGIWIKLLAAVVFAVFLCILFGVFYFELYMTAFGAEGLSASSQLIGSPFFGFTPESIGGFFLFEWALALAGMVLLAGVTALLSAFSKSSFLTVIASLIIYAVPIIWLKVLAPTWILGTTGTKLMNHFMVSMPVWLQWNWGFTFDGGQISVHLLVAAVVGVSAFCCAYFRYRSYQGQK